MFSVPHKDQSVTPKQKFLTLEISISVQGQNRQNRRVTRLNVLYQYAECCMFCRVNVLLHSTMSSTEHEAHTAQQGKIQQPTFTVTSEVTKSHHKGDDCIEFSVG